MQSFLHLIHRLLLLSFFFAILYFKYFGLNEISETIITTILLPKNGNAACNGANLKAPIAYDFLRNLWSYCLIIHLLSYCHLIYK